MQLLLFRVLFEDPLRDELLRHPHQITSLVPQNLNVRAIGLEVLGDDVELRDEPELRLDVRELPPGALTDLGDLELLVGGISNILFE